MTPLEKLCQISDTQGRIDAVAADLKKQQRQFNGIDPWDLAAALSLQLNGPANCLKAIGKCSLDDYDESPAWENLELLEGRIPAARYAQLQTEGQEMVDGTRSADITLEPEERQLMEVALAEKRMEDGGGWQINQHTLMATDGEELCFEVTQGDGGELTDLTGPYEIHDNGWPEHEGVVIGEGWTS
jgi:hypothetical protein